MKKNRFLMKYLPYLFAMGVLAILFMAGLSIYKDFGVPVDEPSLIQFAIKNHLYLFKSDPALLSEQYRFYGMVFELPLFWVATRFTGPETVYVRHLVLYLAFLASLVVFYLLSLRLFRNPWWGLLAVCMLAVSPRIFSDAFYNSKDVAFMDVFILAIWTLVITLDGPQKRTTLNLSLVVLAHALASALLIGTRIVGVMIVPLSVVLMGVAFRAAKTSWRTVLLIIAFYLVCTAGLTVLFWPILWNNPIQEFINAFQQMSRYNVYGKGVLFQGKFYSSETLPWQYLPVWIGISTPIFILAGFALGIGHWIYNIYLFFRKELGAIPSVFCRWISTKEALEWLAVAGWLAIPIISIFLFHSVLYNGWRHLFFIYPAIILFSTRGFSSLYGWLLRLTRQETQTVLMVAVILAIGFLEPLSFLVRYPRYGTAYFNQLAGDPKTLRQRFELDYWGLSYKEAIDYILATDHSDKIPVYMADVSGLDYINSALPEDQKSRLVILDNPDNGARYFIGNFSFHPDEYQYSKSSPEYYSITVRGIKILVVYKFH